MDYKLSKHFIEEAKNGLPAHENMLKSLIITERHIKTTVQYHCTPISMTNT